MPKLKRVTRVSDTQLSMLAAYAKNTNKLGLTIDYQSVKGHFRLYQPDFVVRLTSSEHWLIETKGLEDVEVALKDDRARAWCGDATALSEGTEAAQRWQYARVQEDLFRGYRGHTFDGLVKTVRATMG